MTIKDQPRHGGASTGRLSLERVSKRYKDVAAVAEVSLDVPPGEFLTLLGPSGSGKTTTLSMIAGFIRASSGRIVMDGRDLSEVPPHRRDIGMVFQNYALFPHMSAEDNVAFPLRMRKCPRDELNERVTGALARVELEAHRTKRPHQLSGGQQQRIALARAIVFEPQLLLMDEPLGALDKKLREGLQLEISHLGRSLGVTIIYVTHDQEEALVMSDRIAIYNQGRVEQIGSPEELYECPSSVFVAGFLGDANLFPGVFERAAGGGLVTGDNWKVSVPSATPQVPSGDSRVAAMIRPENVRIEAAGEARLNGSSLAGTLREIVYMGSAWQYLIELTDGTVLKSRTAVRPEQGRVPGDSVVARWAPADVVLVPLEGPTRAGVLTAAATDPSEKRASA